MPSTPIEEQDATVAAGQEETFQFPAASRHAVIQFALTGGDADSLNVYVEGRLADYMPWTNIDPPRESPGNPENIRGIPPWQSLSGGAARGPTAIDTVGIPSVRVRVQNTGTTDATVDLVARSANSQ